MQLMDLDKWLQHRVLQNRMRASALRIEMLMQAIEQACKRRVNTQATKKQVAGEVAQDEDLKSAGVTAGHSTVKHFTTKRLHKELNPQEASLGTDAVSSLDIFLAELKQLKVIAAIFPLHQKEGRRWLSENWARVPLQRLVLSWKFWFAHAPLDEIRDYFGEEEAFYFAYLSLYTQMLWIPAVIGFVIQAYTGVVGFTSASEILTPFFCTFIAIWAISFVGSWKRKEAELAQRWGMGNRDDVEIDEEVRAEFVGTPQVNPYTDEIDVVRTKGMAWGYAFFVLFLVIAATTIGIFLFILGSTRDIMLAFGPPEESFAALLWFNVGLGFTCAIVILAIDEIYYKLAKFFTDKENHRTDKDYDKATIAKLLCFYLLTSNITLLHLAFYGKPCR